MLRRIGPARRAVRLPEAAPALLSWGDPAHSCDEQKDRETTFHPNFVDPSTTHLDSQQGLLYAYLTMPNSFHLGYRVSSRIARSAVLLQTRGLSPMQSRCIPFHGSLSMIKSRGQSYCIHEYNVYKSTTFWKLSGPSGSILIFSRPHMGHSHDHHDHRHHDDTGEAGERVSRLGLIADICLTGGKAFAGYASGSTAVIADAAHSMSDVVLSAVALWIFKAARAPKDRMHPYGHGKFESLGALGISTMLLLTGGGIAWHALEVIQGVLSATDNTSLTSFVQSGAEHARSLGHTHSHGGHHHGIDEDHQLLALSATVISICVKEGLYQITRRVADARGSELLRANAWHHRSDAISSVIALLGVGGAMLGWQFLDPLAGLLVSGLIMRAGVLTGYQSLQELVDAAVSDSVLASFKETVMKVEGVKGCHSMRGRRAGSLVYLDVHIEVDPWLSMSAAHIIGEAVRQKLKENHPSLEEVFIHIEPGYAFSPSSSSHDSPKEIECNGKVAPDDLRCQQELQEIVCELIQSRLDKVMAFERLTCHFLQGRLVVELEVSMEPTIAIRDAMQYAKTLEELIKEAYPKVSAVETRLNLTSYS